MLLAVISLCPVKPSSLYVPQISKNTLLNREADITYSKGLRDLPYRDRISRLEHDRAYRRAHNILPKPTAIERFARYIEQTPTCQIWTGKTFMGYGKFKWNGRSSMAHRFAYEQFVAPIPEGLDVCHTCDNPPCVAIEHLWLGTASDNVQDSIRKGRANNGFKGKHLTEEHRRKLSEARKGKRCPFRGNQYVKVGIAN